MNEEIEYAEMLEIPVSTVNVVKKQRRRKQKAEPIDAPSQSFAPIKESVIAQVNDRLQQETQSSEEAELLLGGAGSIDFDIPERIDTVRVYSTQKRDFFRRDKGLQPDLFALEQEENDGGRDETNPQIRPVHKGIKIALNAEFAAACALCGVIFFTNVFLPGSAINSFFRALNNPKATTTDTRKHTDFTLSPVVGVTSDAELTLSPTGILTFTEEGCVYPAADGTVKEVVQESDGTYRIKIAHSDLFTGVIGGLDYVYYGEGESVKSNVPLGYSQGETQVQVTMYLGGELLNCFELTEENCLAWVTE